jgi:signal transduction histidine kinase
LVWEGNAMRVVALAISALSILAAPLAADEFGTAEEAKAMLERAVIKVKEDKESALAAFTAGAEGFRDRDLYVFCGGEDGNFTAHGADNDLVGESMQGIQDKAGFASGATMYENAAEGEIKELGYMWPRPGETEPSQKSSYYTKVDDQICGVGYYK